MSAFLRMTGLAVALAMAKGIPMQLAIEDTRLGNPTTVRSNQGWSVAEGKRRARKRRNRLRAKGQHRRAVR